MINVNQITAQLARMPDQALQQYAQMHKDDPYVLSLALSESNRRKQTRQGAQMGGQEQPKVVDQELQSMAAPMPEDVGIGQLPAGDMHFADGGIVAFSDGGDVPRYNGTMGSLTATQAPISVQELSRLYRLDPTLAKEAALRAGPAGQRLLAQAARLAGSATAPLAVLEGGVLASGAAASTLAGASPEQREQFYSSPMLGAQGGDAGLAAAILNAPGMEPPKSTSGSQIGKALLAIPRFLVSDPSLARERDAQQAKEAAATPSATDRLSAGDRALRQQPVAAPKSDTGAPRQRPPAGGPEVLGGPGPGPAAPAPGITALQSPAQMYQNALEATPLVDPAAGQREALGKEMIGGAQQRMAARQAEIEKEGDVFKGRGERISKREEALGKDKEQMTGLAFLEAGLAVMSTPGGLATALGKGARVGTERFAAGLDKLRAAQERLEDAKDNLETLRLNRSDMNAKDIRAMQADIDRAKLDAQKLGIDGIMQASDLRHKQASEIFKASSEQSLALLKEAGANQRQQMASAATVQAAKIAAAQRGTRLEDELREQYAKSAVLRAQYPNVKDFLAAVQGTSSIPPVQAQPGAGGVRP